MNMKNHVLILAGLVSASVMAQSRMESGEMSSLAQLEKTTENGITYVCGGIGQTEAQALKKAASKYDVMMTFAASNGAYLADVGVDIANAQGKSVLAATCDGPIMLVNFPEDGRYVIAAEAGGRTLKRTAQVRGTGNVNRIAMAWPTQTVDMGLTPGAGPGEESSGSAPMEGGRASSQR